MVQNNAARPKLVQYIGVSMYPLSVGGKKHENTNKKEKTTKKNNLFLSVLLSIRVSVIGGRKSQPERVSTGSVFLYPHTPLGYEIAYIGHTVQYLSPL